jgi:hypothetical protein
MTRQLDFAIARTSRLPTRVGLPPRSHVGLKKQIIRSAPRIVKRKPRIVKKKGDYVVVRICRIHRSTTRAEERQVKNR